VSWRLRQDGSVSAMLIDDNKMIHAGPAR